MARFLVRMNAAVGNSLVDDPAGSSEDFRLSPLMPQSRRPGGGFGINGEDDWYVATTESDGNFGELWDECHARIAGANTVGLAAGKVTYAEPDIVQPFVTEDMGPQAFGLADPSMEQRWMAESSIPHGMRFDWHLDDAYSGLRSAANSLPQQPWRVRIGHLDTGYTYEHKLLPERLEHHLERSFVSGDNAYSAVDPFITGVLKSPGHGTGTLGLLAGSKFEGLSFDDEDRPGEYLGGAPRASVVPVRIASSVVLLYTSGFALGLDYLLGLNNDPATRVDVVSMSMGGLASAAWTDIVNRAYDAGVVLCTAAGNHYGLTPPTSIVYPARYRRVIAVCGVMQDGRAYADLPANIMCGCYGPQSKMSTSISAYSPNLPWALYNNKTAFRWDGQGTSAATPQVAAAAALYFEKNYDALSKLPGWARVEAVRRALFTTARKSAAGTIDAKLGNGSLDALTALGVPVADITQLTEQAPDSASFPFLRVLLGMGMASDESIQMMQVEMLQLTQMHPELSAIVPDPDADDKPISDKDVNAFLSAITTIPEASKQLRATLNQRLKGSSIAVPDVPGADKAPRGEEGAATKPVVERRTWQPPPPPCRRLRGYVFDPSVSTQLQYVDLSETTYTIPWESAAQLKPGPIGEYLEVVDPGETPIDLNSPHLLAQDGLEPSESSPQFRQQMVYAVGMQTISVFEGALGRLMQWAPDQNGNFAKKLKLLPHGIPAANAFYSPPDRAIYFGYFKATNLTGSAYGMVYAALSHDIIAHEMTHALLDGLHKAFREPSNPDVMAFHEGFADIVALLQQFGNKEVVRNQCAAVSGNLSMENLLGNLARQFGDATTGHAALRSAYLSYDQGGNTTVIKPEKTAWKSFTEPHTRGSFLVAAVYGAFLAIYKTRTADLYRIASNGSMDAPLHEIAADLVNRLAGEAARSARHVLRMCIRALDYCPPVDINFGDYLRAIISADIDVVPDDSLHYRVAFIESFRKWGIYPDGVNALSVESLVWPPVALPTSDILKPTMELLRTFAMDQSGTADREKQFHHNKDYKGKLETALRKVLQDGANRQLLVVPLGLDPDPSMRMEVTRLRFSHKVSPTGEIRPRVLVSICQSNGKDAAGVPIRWGVTIIMDLSTDKVLYGVKKPQDAIRKARAAQQLDKVGAPTTTPLALAEPFMLLHQR